MPEDVKYWIELLNQGHVDSGEFLDTLEGYIRCIRPIHSQDVTAVAERIAYFSNQDYQKIIGLAEYGSNKFLKVSKEYESIRQYFVRRANGI